jgi:cation:H+ antiporter
MSYILLLVGFALLIKGADYFVEGSSKIAGLLRVPPLLIGLTIVAFGTSSPEAAVSILAALKGSADVAIGNSIGSNIFMITLVIGITSFILPIKVEHDTIRKEIPFTLLASVAFLVLMSDMILQGASENEINRGDGAILLLFFSIFIYYIIEAARNSRDQGTSASPDTKGAKWGKNIFFTIAGLAAIIYGGHLVVTSSTKIALSWGMSETLVGLTIVAIGTSLPEFITSIAAAVKKQLDIALGNIVGSTIFNLLFVLGISALITPLGVGNNIFLVVIIMIAATAALLVFAITKLQIGKIEGIILSLVFIAYMIYIILTS